MPINPTVFIIVSYGKVNIRFGVNAHAPFRVDVLQTNKGQIRTQAGRKIGNLQSWEDKDLLINDFMMIEILKM